MSKPDQPNVTVVIPVREDEQDSDWLKEAVASFPNGTPYVIAAGGSYAEAVNEAVREAATKWVLVFSRDNAAGPHMLDIMLTSAFAADVVYQGVMDVDPGMTVQLGGEPVPPFCNNRILFEDYIPSGALVLRDRFLEVGGYREEAAPLEAWDLYVRGRKEGWRFKPVQTTFYYRRVVEGRTSDVDRQRMLDVVIGEPQPMKATFYYQATHACAYLRCILPARYLPGVARGDMFAHVRLKDGVEKAESEDDIEAVEFPFHQGDAAVLQFAGDSTWAVLQHHLQEQGVRTLVEVDDNYLVDPGKEVRTKSNWGQRIGEAVHTYQGHKYIVSWADGVIVTTEQLAASYRKVNDNVYVIPNPVDPWDWRGFPPRPDDGVLRIGWFASASHMKDIPLVTRALEWASRQKDVQVITLGIDPKWNFNYTPLAWVDDLDAYRMLMGMLDVGLCPVVPDQFSLFRSDIKSSEYAMAGAAVICSDVPPYADWRHDEFCLKARTAKDFYHHVKRLVQNRDEMREMARAGREWVNANRNIHRLMPLWEEALEVKKPLAVAA